MTKRLILALLLSCSPLWATTYYVDNCVTVGNDRNNGASTSTPWLTINKVNTSKFNPGDSILFESTCTWREQLTVPSSGSAGVRLPLGPTEREEPLSLRRFLDGCYDPTSDFVKHILANAYNVDYSNHRVDQFPHSFVNVHGAQIGSAFVVASGPMNPRA